MSWSDFKNIFFFAVVAVAGLVFVAVIFLTYAGKLSFMLQFVYSGAQWLIIKCLILPSEKIPQYEMTKSMIEGFSAKRG